jgi:DNA mismatch endonuclease, patch repair protein
MPEFISVAQRSQVMAAVKSRDTQPELYVRRIAHRLGFRFRLHVEELPGTPDIVFPRLKKIINVHGCFWHSHRCRHGQRSPVLNASYWQCKRARNVVRDRRVRRQLRRIGWQVLTIWECQLRDVDRVTKKIADFLGDVGPGARRRRGNPKSQVYGRF